VHHHALLALSPSANLTSFLTELATALRGLLLVHFAKFQVSAAGGIMVTKDISKYNELLRSWDLGPGFQPSLEVLTEIGNLFVIGPDALRERLRGKGGNGVWDKEDLRPYVARRDDAGSVGVQTVLSAL
jgi:exocyst complex component 5